MTILVLFHNSWALCNFLYELQIMEKLVDIVTFLQQAILEAFGNNGRTIMSPDGIRKFALKS